MQCPSCEQIKAGLVQVGPATHPICALRPDQHEVDAKGRTLNAVFVMRLPTPEENKTLNAFLAGVAEWRDG